MTTKVGNVNQSCDDVTSKLKSDRFSVHRKRAPLGSTMLRFDTDNSSKDTLSKEKPVAGDNCRHPVSNMSAGSEDDQRFNDSSADEPAGLCDSSTDEERTDGSDSDGDDIVNFVDWRKDGWASLRVGSRRWR